MHNIIRFYNQNRKQIIRAILIIAFIIILIQLLNYFAKLNNNNNQSSIISNDTYSIGNSGIVVSNKSAISGTNVSGNKLKEDINVINEFIDSCNDGNISKAYNLITDECKEEMYPTENDFYNNYYISIFNNTKLDYTVENWVEDTYEVKFLEDILSTGNVNENGNKQDYITVVEQNDQFKININNYIGRYDINKESNYKNIKSTVIKKDTYMDYEIYTIKIQNNTGKRILLDTKEKTNSIYLLNNNDAKLYAMSNEIMDNELLLENNYINTISIKFNSTYSSSNTIKKLVFSNVILDYNNYLNSEDKENYDNIFSLEINL